LYAFLFAAIGARTIVHAAAARNASNEGVFEVEKEQTFTKLAIEQRDFYNPHHAVMHQAV
jgi:hypothetical protein